MPSIFALSGSAAAYSSNVAFLEVLRETFAGTYDIQVFDTLRLMPLFSPDLLEGPLPERVQAFKKGLRACDAVVICTPEYNHNIPAALKSALEWTSASGEFHGKRVIPITFTPHAPRGEWAIQSLLNSLKAMEANIPVHVSLYKNEFSWENDRPVFSAEQKDFLKEVLGML